MMRLFLAPEDVWLFRDGRPFDAGSSHRARSLFPPYPSVLQGVIRSHHLIVKDINLNDRSKRTKQIIIDTVGTADTYGSLEMRGPFIAKYRDGKLTRFLPRPADWFPVKGDESKIHALSPLPRSGMVTSGTDGAGKYFLPQLIFPPAGFKPGKKEYGEWLKYEDLLSYLNGGKVMPVAGDQLFLRESRVGIQIKGGSRAVEPGMLYEAEFVRPCDDVGLFLEVKGYNDWQQTGMIKIGGESHAARFEQLGDDVKVEWLATPQPLPKRFKIYFATPAYFEKGWEPSNWTQFFGIELKPVAVALKGYDTVGGFDYAAHGDKASRRYVPAGSVYYFESDREINLVKNEFTEAMGQIGFGQVMIAEWK